MLQHPLVSLTLEVGKVNQSDESLQNNISVL